MLTASCLRTGRFGANLQGETKHDIWIRERILEYKGIEHRWSSSFICSAHVLET